MAEPQTVAIRSFRVCFRFERRIHKIDRWRLPLPFGVPLRGAGYALALLLAVLISRRLPIIGDAVWILPAPLRFVLLPIGSAYLLAQWEPDGRPAHAVMIAWLRMQLAPSRLVGFRRAPTTGVATLTDVTIVADESSVRLRPAIVHGPAEIVLRYPFEAHQRGRTLRVAPREGSPRWRGKRIRVHSGQRVRLG
jgi:hypothetical protein